MMMMDENLVHDATYGHYAVYAGSMRAIVVDTLTGTTVKRYAGETAWMDADRYAGDLDAQEQYA